MTIDPVRPAAEHGPLRPESLDVHAASLQLAHPDWSLMFDVDPEMAAASRARTLDRVATDRLAIAGMHMPLPGRRPHQACRCGL